MTCALRARPAHRAWLGDQFARLVAFHVRSIRPAGGFEWLDDDGMPRPARPPQLFLTARMAYVGGLGAARGVPGGRSLMDHAVATLRDVFADPEHGGWHAEAGVVGRKTAYEHVHVAFGLASATAAGSAPARELLPAATRCIDERFWSEEEGALTESYAADWSHGEDYRGANSNMHGLEAFLALAAVTGRRHWLRRGLRVAQRLIDGAARGHDWLLPEHYTARWEPILQYHHEDPRHRFRPYGWTPGHAFEWARLVALLHLALGADAPQWLLPAARALCETALARGWAPDGVDGIVYTTDWDGVVIEDRRLHWPLCEAIQAVAVLDDVTGHEDYGRWYARFWEHAARYFVDTTTGTWANERSGTLGPSADIWPGRADAYHTTGALLAPLYPSSSCLVVAAGTNP